MKFYLQEGIPSKEFWGNVLNQFTYYFTWLREKMVGFIENIFPLNETQSYVTSVFVNLIFIVVTLFLINKVSSSYKIIFIILCIVGVIFFISFWIPTQ